MATVINNRLKTIAANIYFKIVCISSLFNDECVCTCVLRYCGHNAHHYKFCVNFCVYTQTKHFYHVHHTSNRLIMWSLPQKVYPWFWLCTCIYQYWTVLLKLLASGLQDNYNNWHIDLFFLTFLIYCYWCTWYRRRVTEIQ